MRFIVWLLMIPAQSIAQEYTYDANSNLATDSNKQIASIHYDYSR